MFLLRPRGPNTGALLAKANLFGISYPSGDEPSYSDPVADNQWGGCCPDGRIMRQGTAGIHRHGFRLFLDRWPTKHIRGSHVPLVCCHGPRPVLDGLARVLTGSAMHHACYGRYSIMMILPPGLSKTEDPPVLWSLGGRPVTMHMRSSGQGASRALRSQPLSENSASGPRVRHAVDVHLNRLGGFVRQAQVEVLVDSPRGGPAGGSRPSSEPALTP